MHSPLAIYDALLQSRASPDSARRVAECLDNYLAKNLATKPDVLHFQHRMNARFDAMEDRITLTMRRMESRIILKLGTLMAVLLGFSIALLKSGG
jgi:hypothetical protein